MNVRLKTITALHESALIHNNDNAILHSDVPKLNGQQL